MPGVWGYCRALILVENQSRVEFYSWGGASPLVLLSVSSQAVDLVATRKARDLVGGAVKSKIFARSAER